MTRDEALAFAKNMGVNYPGWLDVLPPCPCTLAEAKAAPSEWVYSATKDLVLPIFHPGAKSSVRSAKGYQSVPGTSHGQQCCYDGDGNLITEGPAAGTPDLWSPETHFSKHQDFDVKTFKLLGWRTYNEYWKPNPGKGCGCPPNAGGGKRIGSGKFKIVGAFDETDLFLFSIVHREVKASENVIVVETGNVVGGLVGGRGHYSNIEVVPDNDAAVKLFGNDKAKYVPSYLLQPVP